MGKNKSLLGLAGPALAMVFFYMAANTWAGDQQAFNIRIAFGSCSDQDKKQVMWPAILQKSPDVWLWLGDNIYADTKDPKIMAAKYNKQKNNSDYQKLLASSMVLGTWDDNDYGENDADKEFPRKVQSQQLFLDFFDVPKDSPRRTQQGVYSSHEYSKAGILLKFYMLDVRYFRDSLEKKNGRYVANQQASLLGDTQWQWLEEEFKNSKADINIIASGIQVIPEDHRWDKWADFPGERKRLFELVHKYGLRTPLFISGDRHIGEISRLNYKGRPLYEVTASSLTHGWGLRRPEVNKHRVGEIVYDLNFGMLEISPTAKRLSLYTREGLVEHLLVGL
ncbi:alkaline phosphatase D [Alteromonadaceae bacterium Bs31]|nr:alkaline phosphatase D [Alteromonadaceae bacterium Bs31]